MNDYGKQIKLFEEFDPVSKESWKKQILHDLKAATLEEKQALYEQKMIWESEKNITVQPFYTQEDTKYFALPFVAVSHPGWHTQELIRFSDEKTANQLAKESLRQGADALCFDLTKTTISSLNFSLLLQDIKLADIPVSFSVLELPGNFIKNLQALAPYHWKGSLNYDSLTQSVTAFAEANIQSLAEVFIQTIHFTDFYPLTVNSPGFNKAGISASEEISSLIAAFVEYVHQLTDRGISAGAIFNKTILSVPIGTNYFMEIAKLRALRVLYSQVAEAYGVNQHKVFIHAQTNFPLEPTDDPHTNMIRATLAAMAAILGVGNSLTVLPHNLKQEDAFASRIARNISLILKEESYFAQVADISNGSYYIENLTRMLADEAWRLFLQIEAEGGFVQAKQSGLLGFLKK